jgi:hypothetical protein
VVAEHLTMDAAQAPGRVGSGRGLESPGDLGGSERVYSRLLRLYPTDFRRRYRDEMVLLFSDQLRDARSNGRAGGAVATWFRSLVDLVANAIGEHLRMDRRTAQSLATFEPTRGMRLLGLFGVIGAGLLLWAFVSWNAFADPTMNLIRLLTFSLAGAAISIGFYGRQAAIAPRLALVSTSVVVIAGAWYVLWLLLSPGVKSPFMGTFGLVNFLAGLALWLSPVLYGAAMLRIGAAWRGMSRTWSIVTRLGAVFLLGSSVAWLGDDRLGLVDSEYGAVWQAVAMTGVGLNGLGWTLLGAVLVLGGPDRRARLFS